MNDFTSRVIHVASGQMGRSFWGPPPHKHLAEDELFAITSGSITFTAGSDTRTVSAGESVCLPARDAPLLSQRELDAREDDRRLHARRNGGVQQRERDRTTAHPLNVRSWRRLGGAVRPRRRFSGSAPSGSWTRR
jgi:Cupin domain